MFIITCLDITFFSAGFYELDGSNTNIGQDYNITFHDVAYNNANENLQINDRISVKDDPLWLNCELVRSLCLCV